MLLKFLLSIKYKARTIFPDFRSHHWLPKYSSYGVFSGPDHQPGSHCHENCTSCIQNQSILLFDNWLYTCLNLYNLLGTLLAVTDYIVTDSVAEGTLIMFFLVQIV